MGRTESDSGGETTETTTTTAPSPHDVAIGAPAVRKEREAREAHERAAAENAQREQAREVGAPGALVLPETGGAERPRRLLLIGLDGAATTPTCLPAPPRRSHRRGSWTSLLSRSVGAA